MSNNIFLFEVDECNNMKRHHIIFNLYDEAINLILNTDRLLKLIDIESKNQLEYALVFGERQKNIMITNIISKHYTRLGLNILIKLNCLFMFNKEKDNFEGETIVHTFKDSFPLFIHHFLFTNDLSISKNVLFDRNIVKLIAKYK